MNFKVGTVLINDDGSRYVVVTTENGAIKETQRLEEYIAMSLLMRKDGEYKSVLEVIRMECDRYEESHDRVFTTNL